VNFIARIDMGQWARADAITVGRDMGSGEKLLNLFSADVIYCFVYRVYLQRRNVKPINAYIHIEYTRLVLNMTG
jgi:hypothetical protein